MSFDTLGLSEALVQAVAREGYENPTPIQQQAIPLVLQGVDVLAAAQTGTGKTAAFTLPLLQRLGEGKGKAPRALVLTPTRELAAQVAESVNVYGRNLNLRHTVIFGGVGHQPQVDALRRGVDLIVATPGRLLEHVADGQADLSKIEIFVLDEADRMLDMGFIHDIRRVLKVLPAKRQNLLFSATFSDDIRKLAKTFLHDPKEVDIAPRNATVDTVEQRVMFADQKEKRQLLCHLIQAGNWQQVLVFARMKHGANRLCDYLNAEGLPAAALHGNKSQSARTRALSDFKAGRIRVLVATDIAARGIDIDQLPHVINFELPNVPEDYVHRIGRTGRAGNEGEALSLVSGDERAYLKDIQKLIKREIPVLAQPEDFVPRPAAPEPPRPPRPAHGSGRGGQRPAQRAAPRAAKADGEGASRPRPQGGHERGGQERGGQERGGPERGGQERGGQERRHSAGGHAGAGARPARPQAAGERAERGNERFPDSRSGFNKGGPKAGPDRNGDRPFEKGNGRYETRRSASIDDADGNRREFNGNRLDYTPPATPFENRGGGKPRRPKGPVDVSNASWNISDRANPDQFRADGPRPARPQGGRADFGNGANFNGPRPAHKGPRPAGGGRPGGGGQHAGAGQGGRHRDADGNGGGHSRDGYRGNNKNHSGGGGGQRRQPGRQGPRG